jgi:hypothetical protein
MFGRMLNKNLGYIHSVTAICAYGVFFPYAFYRFSWFQDVIIPY